MKVLVTGASAFIGSTISESLSRKYDVSSPSSTELNLLDSEKVKDYLKINKFDFIIHCANHLVHPLLKESKNPELQLINNLKMFFNFAYNKDLFGKMIYFGSGAEFSREKWTIKMKEDFFGAYYPNDQYGQSKYYMNIHTRNTEDIYNLRLFGMFGEKDDWRFRFIPYLCAKASLNEDLIVNQDSIFGFLYADDLVSIIIRFMENPPKFGDYNVCNDEHLHLLDIAKTISRLGNKNKIILKKKGILTSYSGDNSKLIQAFPDLSFTPVNVGIEKVLKFYIDSPGIIDQSKFLI